MKVMNLENKSSFDYRADIDGLRGISVLMVVLYHAFPTVFSGGFVGVDIFFVISGFLINSIILNELSLGKFSFKNFYARRIKRIFPALILALFFGIIFGWKIMLPDEYKELGKHIFASSGFVSNFLSKSEVDYFDKAAESKAYLHLWSLSIEEQFYLFWPLLMYFWWILRDKKTQFIFCIILALYSFYENIHYVKKFPTEVFYSPHTRFWEILLGCLISFYPDYFKKIKLNILSLISVIGGGVLVYSFMHITKQQLFPGTIALLPILGAVLLIIAGEKAFFNRRLLTLKPLVYVGLISYPLYLWHWLFLVSYRIYSFTTPTSLEISAVVFFSFVISSITYHLIEVPIRKLKSTKLSRLLIYVCLSLFVLAGFCGYIIYSKNGINSRLPPGWQQIRGLDYFGTNSAEQYQQWRRRICFLDGDQFNFIFPSECASNYQHKKTNVFLWGDSTAASLIPGLIKLQESEELAISQFTGSSCWPGSDEILCKNIDKQAVEKIRLISPDIILIHANWSNENENYIKEIVAPKLREEINKIGFNKRKVVILGPDLQWRKELTRVLYETYRVEGNIPFRLKRSEIVKGTFTSENQLANFAKVEGYRYISMVDLLCDRDTCLAQLANHSIITFDSVHLSPPASIYIVNLISKIILNK